MALRRGLGLRRRGRLRRWGWGLAWGLVVALGLAVRLYDLTDLPLDFHPTRQYHGLLLARSLYLRWRPGPISPLEVAQRAAGNKVALYEPLLLEGLVAWTYLRLGGVFPWVVRVYNALFWLTGAFGVGLLARRLAGRWGAWVAVAYWMLLPFGVYASRAFQPDPLMTVLLVWLAYSAYRWGESGKGGWLLGATLCAAMAGVVKAYALFFVIGVFLGAGWMRRGRAWWREVRWWIALGVVVLGVMGVYLGARSGRREAFFLSFWIWRMARLWLTPYPYGGWVRMVVQQLGGGWTLAAALAVLWAPSRSRTLLLGWLLGYGLYGLTLPAQIATHSYYHLPLVPWVAWGLALGTEAVRPWLVKWTVGQRVGLAFLVMLTLAYPAGEVYWTLRETDYRPLAAAFAEIGTRLPQHGKVVALTQAYGWPLLYHGGVRARIWPSQARQRWLGRQAFRRWVGDAAWFVVTDWEEWGRQGKLRALLTQCFPVWVETPAYRIYDLRHPLAGCALP